jgi:hypothetical protein
MASPKLVQSLEITYQVLMGPTSSRSQEPLRFWNGEENPENREIVMSHIMNSIGSHQIVKLREKDSIILLTGLSKEM